MKQQELKAKFQQLFRAYTSGSGDSHVREGSVVVDQVINPLTMALQPIFSDIEDVVKQNNPPDDTASGDLLDSIGERFLASRSEGGRSTANVRLLMNERKSVTLGAGASVFADNLQFKTVRRVEFAESNFTQVTRNGLSLYESPDIAVVAIEEGPEYQVESNKIRTPAFALDGMVGVYNPAPSSPATRSEDDDSFRNRLRRSISSRSMDTYDGARFILSEQFPDLTQNIVIVEPGDPEMRRDLIRTYEEVTTAGFSNKVRDSSDPSTGPNSSQLFFRTTRNKLQAPSAFDREASQAEYASVTTTDAEALSVDTDILFRDDFTRDRSFQTAIGDGWIAGNTGEAWKNKDASSGIYVNEGNLIFGPRNRRQKQDDSISSTADGFSSETLPVQAYSATEEDKRRAETVSRILEDENVSSETKNKVVQTITKPKEYPVEGYRGIENNTSPVLQRKIQQPYGFRITGTFWTTDPDNPAAFTMARVENGDQASSVGRGEARFRWYEGYGFAVKAGDGTDPNIFIIDNAAANRQLTVVGEEVVGSKLNFDSLSQSATAIDTKTSYRYEMTVGAPAEGDQAMSLSVRIWEEGGTRPASPTLGYGAYTPENRRENLLVPSTGDITSEQANPLDATHVGLGVSATEGTEYWQFSDFQVRNVQESYAQSIADIDVSDIDESSAEVEMSVRGQGHENGALDYGHEVYIWNETLGDWEADPVETSSYNSFAYQTSTFSLDFSDDNGNDRTTTSGKIRLLITSSAPHEGTANDPNIAQLDLDYVEARSYEGQTHTGGKADIFVTQSVGDDYRPSTIGTYTITSASNTSKIDPEDIGGPVAEVINVYNGTSASGPQLEEGSEYRYFWAGEGRRGSMEEGFYLAVGSSFVGSDLTVEARVHNQVSSIHNFVHASNKRKLDADLLPRHKRPVWIDLSLSVEGSLSESPESVVREVVATWKKETIDVAAIASALISRGIDSVNTDTASLSARRITDDGNKTENINFSQTRSRTETFVPGTINVTTG